MVDIYFTHLINICAATIRQFFSILLVVHSSKKSARMLIYIVCLMQLQNDTRTMWIGFVCLSPGPTDWLTVFSVKKTISHALLHIYAGF